MPAARLSDRTSGEAAELGALLLLPVGSLEQHGPHLPLATDSIVAEEVSRLLADRFGYARAQVLPTLTYGASGEHEDFPGTVSMGTAALAHAVLELGRSATRWARRIVVLSGHGGNVEALRESVGTLRSEGRDVAWTTCAEPGWDAHAGWAETSLMLALRPELVQTRRAEPGPTEPVASLLPRLRRHGVAAVSRNGVLGDPSGASSTRGRSLLAALLDRIEGQVRAGETDDTGALLRPSAPANRPQPTPLEGRP